MKYALIAFVVLSAVFLILAALWEEHQDEKNNKYNSVILILLLPFSAIAQNDYQPLSATLDEPATLEESFYITSKQYIEISEHDTIYKQNAFIFVDSTEFYMVIGRDTVSRKICSFQHNYMELRLSCGDWIRPVRDAYGKPYALFYKKGKLLFYFSEIW